MTQHNRALHVGQVHFDVSIGLPFSNMPDPVVKLVIDAHSGPSLCRFGQPRPHAALYQFAIQLRTGDSY